MKRYSLSILGLCLSMLVNAQVQIGNDINGQNSNDAFGWSVAVSGDGETIVVGAPNKSVNGDSSGEIKVMHYDGSSWVQLGTAINGFLEGDNSGRSVDITDDGTTIIIGTLYSDLFETNAGSVQVLEYDGTDWVQKGATLNGSNDGNEFGTSVSISNDGNRIAVGAPYFNSNSNGFDSGVLKIFDYNGSQWNLTFDTEGDNENDVFGMSLDMSGDGNHIICGAWINDDGTTREGYVKVFAFENSSWVQVGATIFGETPSNFFGFSSAISDAGNRVAVGSWANDENGNFSGEVEAFELNTNIWQPLGADLQGDGSFQRYGWSVDLSGNGEILAIGAYQANYAKIYKLTNDTWNQIGNTLFGVNGNDEFGYSVDLTTDGTKIGIGDPSNDNTASFAGFVQVYDMTEVLSVDEFQTNVFTISPNPTSTSLTIQSKVSIKEISIVDVNGRLLNTFEFNNDNGAITIDVEGLSKGVYFLKIVAYTNEQTIRFIKN